MEELRRLTKEERRQVYDEVFREAFPPSELKPLRAIERMIENGEYEMLSLVIDGVPTGFVCNWLDENWVLIDYLCVRSDCRNGGIGAKLMRKMMAEYPEDTVFIGEVEAPCGDPAADALRARRLGFYERLGAKKASYDCALFGVHYQTLYWAKGAVDEAELMRRHDGFYRRAFDAQLYDAAVQLPLKEGEAVKPMTDWIDRPDQD